MTAATQIVYFKTFFKLNLPSSLVDLQKSDETWSPEFSSTCRNLKIVVAEQQGRAYLALQDELEGERALAGEVGVALEVVDAGLQHPRLVENRETWRLVVQAGDEVVGAVRPELHL